MHESSDVTAIYDDNPCEDSFMQYFDVNGIVNIEGKGLNDL